ncbi:MAG: hypothetical protein ACYTG0_26615 [Planctomycetota bacterium]|jgi:hypothetical protein
MRTAILGALAGAGLVMAIVGATPNRGEAFAQHPARPAMAGPSSDLIALSTTVGDKHQQVTMVDPRSRSISVYHIDLDTGDVELRCVRNIHWDLQMEYYNGSGLLPPEIRSALESR